MSDGQWPKRMFFIWCNCCGMPVLKRGLCWLCRDKQHTDKEG